VCEVTFAAVRIFLRSPFACEPAEKQLHGVLVVLALELVHGTYLRQLRKEACNIGSRDVAADVVCRVKLEQSAS